jgi:hypothetical protein
MPRALALSALVSAFLFAPACSRCSGSSPAEKKDAGPTSFEVSSPPKITAPDWNALASYAGVGLPTGCRFDQPLQRATLPEGKVRFATGRRSLSSLVIAVGKDEHVEHAGFVSLTTRAIEPAPWGNLVAPPLFEKSKSGWFSAWIDAGDPARLLAFTGGERANVLAEGDGLALADVACDGDRCVALSSLARTTRTGGATLSTTDGKRYEIDAERDPPIEPVSILSFAGSDMRVLMKSSAVFSIWQSGADGSFAERATTQSPHGVYDGAGDYVAVPDAPPDRPCGRDEFPIIVHAGTRRFTLKTPAPPESLVLRSLADKVLVAWVAPVSCQLLERRVVYVTLLGKDDTEAATPMAIADATGFALAADGDRFSLWLVNGREITWIKGRC